MYNDNLCQECMNRNKQYDFEHELWPSTICDYCTLASDFKSYYEDDGGGNTNEK